MKLLVVTPTLGESPWLAETVASVAAFSACHVLVAPSAVHDAVRRAFPDVSVVADPGAGMYAAINAGIAAAENWDAFTYINDDDLLLPAFAQILARAATVADGVVYGGVRLIGANGRRLGAIPLSPEPSWNRALYHERLEPVYQHGTVLARAAVARLGGFDAALRYCGDSELLARACVLGVPFVCATRAEVAAFRLRPGQLTKRRAAMVAERQAVDVKLGLLAGVAPAEAQAARRRFRWANRWIYAERILRHGFVSFDTLLERGG